MNQSLDTQNLSEVREEERKTFLGFNVVPKVELDETLKSLKEKEKEFKVTKRLETLDKEEISDLKTAIRDSKGVIRVFIHPSHVSLKDGESAEHFDIIKYPPFKMLIDMMVHEKAPPIILLEDERTLDGNRLALEAVSRLYETYNKHVYIMPTLQQNGFVKLSDIETPAKDKKGEFTDMNDLVRYGQLGMNRLSDFFLILM